MVSNAINLKTDRAIKRLMEGSVWGRSKDTDSLIKDLQLEFDELTDGVARKDISNCFEESADVLMLILCILYRLSPCEDEYTVKIIQLLCSKLQWNVGDNDVNYASDEAIRRSAQSQSVIQASSIQTLSKKMKDEFGNLSRCIEKMCVSECFQKTADLLLSILYILNKLSPYEDTYITVILNLLNEKLNRRYHCVLDDSYGYVELNIDEENAIWKRAKKEELHYDLLFCPNPFCKKHCDIVTADIEVTSSEGKCRACGNVFKITRNCILLGEYRTNKRKYLSLLADAVIAYEGGDGTAPTALLEGRKEQRVAYRALQNKIVPDGDKTLAFIKYMSVNHSIDEVITRDFLDVVQALPLPVKSDLDLLEEYIQILRSEKPDSLHRLSPSTLKRIHKQLFALDELPVEQSVEKIISFESRGWDSQITKKLVLQYDAKRKIECMAIVHYSGAKIRDLTFELSNMYGCPVQCAFCASGELTPKYKKLNELDFIRQIDALINETGYSPLDFTNFYVSFAGIGEPSISASEVSLGMRLITDLYPHAKFNIATIGFDPRSFDNWKMRHTNIRTIQIPYYSAENNTLKEIAQNLPDDYNLKDVISSAINTKETNPTCRVKINYIVICGYNDTDKDVERLCAFLTEYKSEIEVKVSYLNETMPSKQKGLYSPERERMKEIHRIITENGFESYIFGTKENPILGCGQLVQNYVLGGEKNEI